MRIKVGTMERRTDEGISVKKKEERMEMR